MMRILKLIVASLGTILVAAECNEPAVSLTEPIFTSGYIGLPNRATVAVSNTGGVDAVLGEVSSAALGLNPPVVLAGGTCTSGLILERGTGTCTLELEYTPLAYYEGTDEGTIELSYSFADKTRSVTRSFTASPEPPLQVERTQEAGAVPLGTPAQIVYRLSNRSGYPGRVDSYQNWSDTFALTGGTCRRGLVLPAETGACTFVFALNPRTPGSYAGEFDVYYDVYHNWPGGWSGPLIATLDLEGRALDPVEVHGPLYVPPTPVGSSHLQTFEVRNVGDAPAQLGMVTGSALGLAPPFSLAGGSCTSYASIPAKGACTIQVAFAPTSPGIVTDTLIVPYAWPTTAHALTASQEVTGNAIASPALE